MSEEKLTIDADVAGFVKAKETVKQGLEEVEKKADAVGRSASKAMDKVTASMERAGKGGAVATAAASAAASAKGAGKANVAGSLGTLAGGAIAGRVGGAAAGRGLGGLVGSAVGPIGTVVGSLIGGLIASAISTRGDDQGPSRDEKRADAISQLVARGFSQQNANSIARMGEDVEAKFKISADRIADAVTEAKAGDNGALKGLLQDAGIDPETVGTVNQALARLAESANGAADKQEQEQQGPVEKSLDQLGKTKTGSFIKDFAAGVSRAPGEWWKNVKSGVANDINMVTNLLGGPVMQEPAHAVAPPALVNDAPLETVAQKKQRNNSGDMRIVVSSPKSVPTVVKNNSGR